MSLQVQQFGNGGYVVHGLTYNKVFCRLRISVWFDKDGHVLDSEGYDSANRPRPVPAKVQMCLGAEFGFVVASYRRQQQAASSAIPV